MVSYFADRELFAWARQPSV